MTMKIKNACKLTAAFAVAYVLTALQHKLLPGSPQVVEAVAPVVAAAAIAAGASLLGGLMSAKAQKEEKKRQLLMEGQQQAFATQGQANQMRQQGEQGALQKMMEAYSRSLT